MATYNAVSGLVVMTVAATGVNRSTESSPPSGQVRRMRASARVRNQNRQSQQNSQGIASHQETRSQRSNRHQGRSQINDATSQRHQNRASIEQPQQNYAAQTDISNPHAANTTQQALANESASTVAENNTGASHQSPELELPPVPTAPAQENVQTPSAIALQGDTANQLKQSTQSSPSAIAATASSLKSSLQNQQQVDAQAHRNKELSLQAETGTPAIAVTPVVATPSTQGAQSLVSNSTDSIGELPQQAAEPTVEITETRESQRQLDRQASSSGFYDWLLDNLESMIQSLPTRDEQLDTSAGERPSVTLQDNANPQQMQTQNAQANNQALQAQTDLTQQISQHSGQSQIQATEQTHTAQVTLTPAIAELGPDVQAQDAQRYAAMALPEDVRVATDGLLQTQFQSRLAQSSEQIDQATQTRDSEQQRVTQEAQNATEQANTQAQREQRQAIINNRQEIVQEQRQQIDQAQQESDTFQREVNTRQATENQVIQDRVRQSESDASQTLQSAENSAERERTQGEREAQSEQQSLEREQDNDSWWDRATSAIKDAFQRVAQRIDNIFTRVRRFVSDIITRAKNAAIGLINRARNFVIGQLERFRTWAQNKINALLSERFPRLARLLNAAIDVVVNRAMRVVNRIADAAVAAVERFASILAAALDRIFSVLQTAVAGAFGVLAALISGDFVEALKIAIRTACQIAGVNPEPIFAFFERAGQAIMNILLHPLDFFNNLVSAVGTGIRNFAENVRTHLISGLIAWLTGAMSSVPIVLPTEFDLKGIIGLVAQLLGLTYDNIKARIIRRFPQAERVFGVIEQSLEVIQLIRREGLGGIWRMVQEQISNLRQQVMEGIRNFVITTVVKQSITWLLSMLNPASALVRMMVMLFDVVMFFVERFAQIRDFIGSVYTSITQIAAGNISQAATAVENAIARSIPVVFGLLASLVGLGNIGRTVSNIIKRITRPINRVIDRIINRVVAFARRLIRRGRRAVRRGVGRLTQWWRARKRFRTESGETHTLFFSGQGRRSQLKMRSREVVYRRMIEGLNAPGIDQAKKTRALAIVTEIETEQNQNVLGANETERRRNSAAKKTRIEGKLNELSLLTSELLKVTLPDWKEPDYGDKNSDGYGTSMKISPLAKQGSGWQRGSVPNDNSASVYNDLNLRRDGGAARASYYIKGHLLNHNIGGPGKWHNMTPLSREGNHQHEVQVESRVKRDFNAHKIQTYEVIPVYSGQSDKASLIQALVARDDGKEDDYRKIVNAEDGVPSALNIKVEILKPKANGNGFDIEESRTKTVPNRVERNPESYFLSTSDPLPPIVPANLNHDAPSLIRSKLDDARDDELKNHASIIASKVQERENAREEDRRRYRTYEDFQSHITIFSINQITRWKNRRYFRLR